MKNDKRNIGRDPHIAPGVYYIQQELCARIDGDRIIVEKKESEDERIRKQIIDYLLNELHNVKQLTPRTNEVEAWISYLEKQKDSDKAVSAIEKVDKYIDARTANAHYMDDSNPDKKYYQGWDDALGKVAGILQDVYSNEKQKEQKLVDLVAELKHHLATTPKEQLEKEWKELEPFGFGPTVEEYLYGKPEKPQWNEEDELMTKSCLRALQFFRDFGKGSCNTLWHPNYFDFGKIVYPEQVENWLKKLSERFNFQPKQEWSEEDEDYLRDVKCAVYDYFDEGYAEELCDWLHPHWKPSEEQISALERAIVKMHTTNDIGILAELRDNLKKL